jgi:hypothetical protein
MSIEETIIGFEKSFKEKNYYNKQTQDNNHLNKIIECLNIKPDMKILDLKYQAFFLLLLINV